MWKARGYTSILGCPVQRLGEDQQRCADRATNIVVAGVKENRNRSVWRDDVARALQVIAGKDVEIVDAFRLGRFNTAKTRQLLVRLRSTWDRRLVLGGGSNMSESDDFCRRVYISPDESPEVRRRSTLQRLAKRAERDNKKVDTSDGILKIDDQIVYTLKNGFLKSVTCSSSSTSG